MFGQRLRRNVGRWRRIDIRRRCVDDVRGARRPWHIRLARMLDHDGLTCNPRAEGLLSS
jgi:hypothetical protein